MDQLLEKLSKDPSTNGLSEEGCPLRALVVDDATFIREGIREILEGVGYEVAGEAANVDEAVQAFSSLKPDLVTMDLVMPYVTGVDAVQQICAIDSQAKIILVTSIGFNDMVKDGLMKGAKDFVIKPINEYNLERFLKALKNAYRSDS